VNISIARPQDIPELCELLASLFDQEAEFIPDKKAQARGLRAVINGSEAGDILVARDNGEIVGMVNLLYTVSTALGARVALLEDMIVSPTGRGQGVGSRLMEHAIQVARVNGCRRITLLTDSDNEGAHRFYKRHGFIQSSMAVFRMTLRED
jgi:GNAT superfamily N-acetyltransferase